MSDNNITPGVLINTLRDNQTNRGTVKAQFANQFFPKLDYKELEGLQASIEKERKKRAQGKIDDEIDFLKKHGYSVSKKK